MARIDTRESYLNNQLEIIDQYCQEASISHDLKKNIRDAMEYHAQKDAFSLIQKHKIFNELPTNLKYEISMQIHNGAIGKHTFF